MTPDALPADPNTEVAGPGKPPAFDPRPVELADPDLVPGVLLVPLSVLHVDALAEVLAGDETAWEHLPVPFPSDRDGIAAWVSDLLDRAAAGTWVPFTVLAADRPGTGQQLPVGVSCYLDIDRGERTVEIGGTIYARAWWAGRVNPSCKFLLLRHAFEQLGAQRVSLKTDIRNTRSQNAMARFGAVREGVLRSTLTRRDGTRRDTVYYSVLPAEWPEVRAGLLARLGSGTAA